MCNVGDTISSRRQLWIVLEAPPPEHDIVRFTEDTDTQCDMEKVRNTMRSMFNNKLHASVAVRGMI